MESNFGNTIASMPQFWDWLENRRGEDNKMSRRVWETVETKTGKIRMAEAEERRKRRKTRKEEEKVKKKNLIQENSIEF